jgi:cyclopropane fatty-acyl-phospholipid synthase-like methyltransferase
LFKNLETINHRPKPYEFYTAKDLWTDEYISKKMLEFHLNENVDAASWNKNFIDRSIKWMIEKFDLKSGSHLADFGCGPGLYSIRLAEKGIEVTGIDFSKRSINYAIEAAEKNGLPIKYIHQDYLEYETSEKYDLIIMIMCDFCALSPVQRKTMLGKYFNLLKPGGSVLLDVHSLNRFNEKKETAVYEYNMMNNFWSPDNYYAFLNVFKYEEEKLSLDKYTIIEKDRIRVIYNWMQCFSREGLMPEFKEAGFKTFDFFSDVAGTEFNQNSLEIAVIARKD